MRKKLSLFLVMLMALTMVLGTGITAMAADLPPAGAPESVRQCLLHPSDTNSLEYVIEIGADKVKVVLYKSTDGSYYINSPVLERDKMLMPPSFAQ